MSRSHELYKKSYTCTTASEVAAVYDEWAEGYDAQMQELGWQAPEQIANMLAQRISLEQRSSMTVLDVGAGTGLVGMALARLGFENIDAFDLSSEMLNVAKERCVYKKLICGRADELCKHLEQPYDAVVCVGALNFGHIAPEALSEIVKATKPGGLIAFSTRQDFFELASQSVQRRLEDEGLWRLVERKVRETSIRDRVHLHWLFQRI